MPTRFPHVTPPKLPSHPDSLVPPGAELAICRFLTFRKMAAAYAAADVPEFRDRLSDLSDVGRVVAWCWMAQDVPKLGLQRLGLMLSSPPPASHHIVRSARRLSGRDPNWDECTSKA